MVLGSCRFEFGERSGKGFGIDDDFGSLDALVSCTKARVRFVYALFQRVVLALLHIGELPANPGCGSYGRSRLMCFFWGCP